MKALRKILGRPAPVQEPSQTTQIFSRLNRLGFRPSHLVDIGANNGDWSRSVMQVFPTASYTLIEPQKRLSSLHLDLESLENVSIIYKGAGDFDGEALFTFHDRDDSCFFAFDAYEAGSRGFRQANMEICKLDTAMKTSTFGDPEVIKIDAEGLDLQVLAGARESLASAEFVFVEASVSNPRFENTTHRVINEMASNGFRLWDITDLNRKGSSGVLWLIECVFGADQVSKLSRSVCVKV